MGESGGPGAHKRLLGGTQSATGVLNPKKSPRHGSVGTTEAKSYKRTRGPVGW